MGETEISEILIAVIECIMESVGRILLYLNHTRRIGREVAWGISV